MSALGRLERRVARFFFLPQPMQGMVAARILLGACLVVIYGRRLGFAQILFGPEGFGGHGFVERFPGAPPLNPNVLEGFAWLRFVSDERVIWGLYVALLAAALAFALGAATRASGTAALLLHLLFYARNPFSYEGSWAEFIHAPLLYVILAPSGAHWSIDAWRRRRRGAPPAAWLAPAWPLRLFQLHVCAMYVAAAWSRLDKESWLAGELVFVALSGATHGRFAFDWSPARPLLALGTWGALTLEVLAPVCLWLPRVGKLWAAGLVALHLSLELMTNVGGWNYVMIAGALTFLLPLRRREVRPDASG